MSNYRPQARTNDITVAVVDDETIVYDLASQEAHALNRAAAAVWRASDGTATVEHLVEVLHQELGLPRDESLVWVALRDLAGANLLVAGIPEDAPTTSRESALRAVGATAAALALVPAVLSVVVMSNGARPHGNIVNFYCPG